jgi:hypothetical protein
MSSRIRVAIAAAAGALTMVLAGPALAAINPKLTISTTAGTHAVTVEGRVGVTDDATARIQTYVPSSFGLKAPVGGTTVGTATTLAVGTQIGREQVYKMVGTITAIGTTDPAIAWENQNCDTQGHVAAWLVRVTGGDDNWTFPIFVDQTTGTETQLGTYKLVACFRPIDGPNKDPYGNKLVSLALALDVFTVPGAPSSHRWRSLWTPYGTDGMTINQAGSVEAQSIQNLQTAALTISGRRTVKSRASISGRLLLGGEPLRNATVAFRRGATKAKLVATGKATTGSSGGYAKLFGLRRSAYFQAGVTLGGQDLGAAACTASFGAAVPCVGATNARLAIVSRVIFVRR